MSPAGLEALGLSRNTFHGYVTLLNESGIPHLLLDKDDGVRTHPLVRAKLLSQIGRALPDEAPLLLERVISYCSGLKNLDAAIRLLLELNAHEEILKTIDSHWISLEEQQLVPQVDSWLNSLPDVLQSHPLYVLNHARVLSFRGESRKLVKYLLPRRDAPGIQSDSRVYLQLWIIEAWAQTFLGDADYVALREQWTDLKRHANNESQITAEFMLQMASIYDLRFESALEHTRAIFQLVPEDAPVYLARTYNAQGIIFHETGRIQEALESYEKAIQIGERYQESGYRSLALLGKAFSCKDVGRLEDALGAVDDCTRIERESGSTRITVMAHVHRTRGEVYWFQGRHTEAFAALEQASSLFEDHNRYEALATGVLLNHWRLVSGQSSEDMEHTVFKGGLKTSEARVRYLIHQSRRRALDGQSAMALELCHTARDMAQEMPSWCATAWFTEAWAQSQCCREAESLTALKEGLSILDRLDRPAYPLADADLTAWIVAEAVSHDVLADRALSLASGETPVDLHHAFQKKLEDPKTSLESIVRLADTACNMNIRGLETAIREHPKTSQDLTDQYKTVSVSSTLPPLTIRLLGGFEVLSSGSEIQFARKASRRILQILLLDHPQAVHEERLMDLLWPEADPLKAKRSLQTSVNELRNTLDPHHQPRGKSYVNYTHEHYSLSLPRASFMDLEDFNKKLSSLKDKTPPQIEEQTLRDCLDLYRGDLLLEDPYEDYVAEARESARSTMLEASARFARSMMSRRPEEAIMVLKRGLTADPFWSEGIGLLLQALANEGRVLAAIRTFREYQGHLMKELGVEPDEPLNRLFKTLTRSTRP